MRHTTKEELFYIETFSIVIKHVTVETNHSNLHLLNPVTILLPFVTILKKNTSFLVFIF